MVISTTVAVDMPLITKTKEENVPRWGGRSSKPAGVAMRSPVGSTPALFRQEPSKLIRTKPKVQAIPYPLRQSHLDLLT